MAEKKATLSVNKITEADGTVSVSIRINEGARELDDGKTIMSLTVSEKEFCNTVGRTTPIGRNVGAGDMKCDVDYLRTHVPNTV